MMESLSLNFRVFTVSQNLRTFELLHEKTCLHSIRLGPT